MIEVCNVGHRHLLKPYSYDQFMLTMDLVYDKIHPGPNISEKRKNDGTRIIG